MWDWSNSSLANVVTLVGLVVTDTVMSLAWDMEKTLGVVVAKQYDLPVLHVSH